VEAHAREAESAREAEVAEDARHRRVADAALGRGEVHEQRAVDQAPERRAGRDRAPVGAGVVVRRHVRVAEALRVAERGLEVAEPVGGQHAGDGRERRIDVQRCVH